MLLCFLPFILLNLHLFSNVFFFLQSLLHFVFLLLQNFILHVLLLLRFLFKGFDTFELLSCQLFLFLQLQIVFIDLQMIHNFDTFHSKYFDSLIYYFLRISTQTIVQFDKIIVIAIKPFTFATIYLHNFSVQIIDLHLKTLYPIFLVTQKVRMLLKHILLVLLHFFDFIFKFRTIVKQHRLNQIFDLNGQSLLKFIEFVKCLYFLLFYRIHPMLQLQKSFHIDGTFTCFSLQISHILQQHSYLFKSFILKKLEVEFSPIYK